MDTLLIGGAWRPARDARTRTIHCPADGREVVTVAEASEADARDAVAAAREAFDSGPWPRTPAPERAALLRRLADRLEAERDEVATAGVARHRQAVRGVPDRRRRHRRRVPALRRPRHGRCRARGRDRDARRLQPRGPRAGRGLLPDHAVELPAAADRVEGRAVPGGRQHLRPQAQRAHAQHRDLAGADALGGRPARRGRQPGARRGCQRGRAAGRRPGRRPGVLHRGPRDRPPDHGRGRADREAGRARARRQEPQRGLRRRRPAGRDRQRPHRGLPRLRPGLLGRCPADRRGERPRPGRRRAGRAGAATSGWAARSTTTPRPARSSATPTAARSSSTSPTRSRTARSCAAGAPARRARRTRTASTTCPRSSTTARPTCGACARSRSGRC